MPTRHNGRASDNRYYVNLRPLRSVADATTARPRAQGGSALYWRASAGAHDAARNFSAVSRFSHLDGVPLVALTEADFNAVFEDMEEGLR